MDLTSLSIRKKPRVRYISRIRILIQQEHNLSHQTHKLVIGYIHRYRTEPSVGRKRTHTLALTRQSNRTAPLPTEPHTPNATSHVARASYVIAQATIGIVPTCEEEADLDAVMQKQAHIALDSVMKSVMKPLYLIERTCK